MDLNNVQVRAGSLKASSGGQLIRASNVWIHPTYGSPDGVDIAVLRLATPLTLSSTVAVIPLASQAPPVGAMLRIAGWGGTVAYAPTESVNQVTSESLLEAEVPVSDVNQGLVYTGFLSSTGTVPDTCQGDSGGPLAIASASSPIGYVLVATVSGGPGCGQGGLESYNVNVADYLADINAQIGGGGGSVATCAAGYVLAPGDIPTNGLIGGVTADCNACAARCNANAQCNSYECSAALASCYLYSEPEPTATAIAGWTFCRKVCPALPGYYAALNKEHNGDDIQHVTNGLVAAAAACSAASNCEGFNSNGWIKTTVGPTQDWTDLCLYSKATCAAGYVLTPGDIPGTGLTGGKQVSNCGQCANQCSINGACNSYQCSKTTLVCYLFNERAPTTGTPYGDYVFCTGGQSAAAPSPIASRSRSPASSSKPSASPKASASRSRSPSASRKPSPTSPKPSRVPASLSPSPKRSPPRPSPSRSPISVKSATPSGRRVDVNAGPTSHSEMKNDRTFFVSLLALASALAILVALLVYNTHPHCQPQSADDVEICPSSELDVTEQ